MAKKSTLTGRAATVKDPKIAKATAPVGKCNAAQLKEQLAAEYLQVSIKMAEMEKEKANLSKALGSRLAVLEEVCVPGLGKVVKYAGGTREEFNELGKLKLQLWKIEVAQKEGWIEKKPVSDYVKGYPDKVSQ